MNAQDVPVDADAGIVAAFGRGQNLAGLVVSERGFVRVLDQALGHPLSVFVNVHDRPVEGHGVPVDVVGELRLNLLAQDVDVLGEVQHGQFADEVLDAFEFATGAHWVVSWLSALTTFLGGRRMAFRASVTVAGA